MHARAGASSRPSAGFSTEVAGSLYRYGPPARGRSDHGSPSGHREPEGAACGIHAHAANSTAFQLLSCRPLARNSAHRHYRRVLRLISGDCAAFACEMSQSLSASPSSASSAAQLSTSASSGSRQPVPAPPRRLDLLSRTTEPSLSHMGRRCWAARRAPCAVPCPCHARAHIGLVRLLA
jgi:hypothetical protein